MLYQRAFLRRAWRFEILNQDEILVHTRTPGTESEYRIPLRELNGQSRRVKQSQHSHLLVALIFTAACAMTLATAFWMPVPAGRRVDRNAEKGAGAVAFGLGLGAALFFFKWIRSRHDFVIFENIAGGESLVLMRNKPDPSEFQAFVDLISKKALSGTSVPGGQPRPSIAREIAELSALKDRGVLTPEEFETAKARLLEGPDRIGF